MYTIFCSGIQTWLTLEVIKCVFPNLWCVLRRDSTADKGALAAISGAARRLIGPMLRMKNAGIW